MSTLRDVAKRARVSPMTVSRVANGASGVRPETRRRVEKAIADLGFIPNGVARGLGPEERARLASSSPTSRIRSSPSSSAAPRRWPGGRAIGSCSASAKAIWRSSGIRRGHDSAPGRGALDRARGRLLEGQHRAACPAQVSLRADGPRRPGARLRSGAGRQPRGRAEPGPPPLSVGHRRIAAIIEPDNVSTARERLSGTARR